jgi:ketosteroid isomerase-like protein
VKNFPGPLLLTTMLLVFAATLRAESSDTAIFRVLEKASAVVAECKIEEYAKLWEEDATIFISSGDPLMPIAEYLQVWDQVCAGGGGMTVQTKERQVRVYGPTAIVTGLMGYTFTGPDGESHSGTTRYSTVLHRAGAEWKMVHAHGSELGVHAGHDMDENKK